MSDISALLLEEAAWLAAKVYAATHDDAGRQTDSDPSAIIAAALLEAEKRGREQERERCIRQARRVAAYYVPFIDERGTGGFEGASLVEATIGSEAELELEDVANTLDVAIRTRNGE